MLTKEVREWLQKVERRQYLYEDAMYEFMTFASYLTKEEQNIIDSYNKIKSIIPNNDYENYSICIAKTPYSIDGNINDKYSEIVIKNLEINYAAKLIIPFISTIYKMPGLPKNPIAKNFKFK